MDKSKRLPDLEVGGQHSYSRRQLITKGLLTAALVCPGCLEAGKALASEWGYVEGLEGPSEWGGRCTTGKKQSPIDISIKGADMKEGTLGPLQFDYHPADVTIRNTGTGKMQVNFPSKTSSMRVGNRTLDLLQYHFHSPSEHAMDGERYEMEAHLVHKDRESGRIAMIGVFMQAVPNADVAPNAALEAALHHAPQEHGGSSVPEDCTVVCRPIQVSAKSLLPEPSETVVERYFHYQGSLTTPPCSEGVEWFLLEEPIGIPDTQLIDFLRYVGDGKTLAFNARPLQAREGRAVTRSS